MGTRRILVTGADGFIGSHLTEALVRRGDSVRAFVLYNSFNSRGWLDEAPREVQREVEFFASDVRDAGAVRNAVRGCDTVLHLAALISIPYSYEAAESFVQTNVTGTLNVLNAALAQSGARVVQTSTSEVYGTAQFVPITEHHPLQAQSPYAATKIAADQLALSFHRAFGLPVAVLRPFNTYGPRQSARAVIPTVIGQLLAGERRIRLGALHPTRDFNYVADVVRAFMAIADADVVGEVVNVSSNYEISIGDTAREIARALGVNATIETDTARVRPAASEVERLWADNAKAARLLGWTPQYAGLDGFRRGLGETIDWFKRRGAPAADKALSYTI